MSLHFFKRLLVVGSLSLSLSLSYGAEILAEQLNCLAHTENEWGEIAANQRHAENARALECLQATNVVFAQEEPSPPPSTTTSTAPTSATSPTTAASTTIRSTELINPIGVRTLPEFAGKVTRFAIQISGVLAFLMFLWGGLLWVTSAGNAEQVTKGKETLLWASLGLVVLFGAYAAVETIIKALTLGTL